MTQDVEEIEENFKDVLSKCKIKTTEGSLKMDNMGEFIKMFSGGKGSSLEEKIKVVENLTTSVPLNGKENWKEVVKNAQDELVHRRSKYVDPSFYLELKFILQMCSIIEFKDKTNLVYALKGGHKLLSMAYHIGWRTVYKHFDIDHKSQRETRKTVDDVFGEEMDSDIEIPNY